MADGNPRLAQVLARRGAPKEVIAALCDGGVLVALRTDRSLVIGELPDGRTALTAFTGLAAYGAYLAYRARTAHLTGAAAPAVPAVHPASSAPGAHRVVGDGGDDTPTLHHVDAPLLADLEYRTGVSLLHVDPAGPHATAVSLADVRAFVLSRGRLSREPTTIHLRPSRHPLVPALRAAIARQLPQFPQVEAVWISDVRLPSKEEGLMLHLGVAPGTPREAVDGLLPAVLAGLPADPDAPLVLARIVDAREEWRLGEMGADVVRP